MAIAAEGIGPGDEVITTPYTFIATVESICYLGAKPVLVDVDPETRNIDPALIEAAITKRTRAIVPVHIAGLPCEMDPILEIAKRPGLAVIEDAAHSLPARYKGKMIGTLSRSTAFSFYATKNLTTAEGGMLTTDDDDLAKRYRLLALHGITSDGWKRYRLGGKWFYEVVAMGYKYNLTDIAAALGIVQLEKLDAFDVRRQELARRFTERLSQRSDRHPAVTVAHASRLAPATSWGSSPASPASTREQFIERMTERGIGTSVHFIPAHLHPYYGAHLGLSRGAFPRAEAAYDGAVSIPLYPAMSDDEVDYVLDGVERSLG